MSDKKGDRGASAPDRTRRSSEIHRREFMQLTGLAFTMAASWELSGCRCDDREPPDLPEPDFSATLLRKEDFVVLRFDFFGLTPNETGDLLVATGGGPRLIVVKFPSQHILERAYLENPEGSQGFEQPVESRLSGPSRVVFEVPDDATPVEFSAEGLLGRLRELRLRVSRNAIARQHEAAPTLVESPEFIVPDLPGLGGGSSEPPPDDTVTARLIERRRSQAEQIIARQSGVQFDTPRLPAVGPEPREPEEPVEPAAQETAIELPYRLIISPNARAAWAHATEPVTERGRTELWHTRLGVRGEDGGVDERGQATLRTIRALWTRDPLFDPEESRPVAGTPQSPRFLTSLEQGVRIAIVHQSSNFTQPGENPEPIDVERLMLTGLGGWLESRGSWGSEPWLGLESWEHRASMGRDHFVKRVLSGYLYPFGHSASLVAITERKFFDKFEAEHRHIAYLWTRFFLVVREPVKSYNRGIRKLPFTEIHVKQLVSPNLDGDLSSFTAFVPKVDGEIFRFPMEGIDRGGNIIRFNAAVGWVPSTAEGVDLPKEGNLFELPREHDIYTGAAETRMDGQRVTFAPPLQPDDSTFEAESITFEALDDGTGSKKPGFVPALEEARLAIEAVRQLSGGGDATPFQYAPAYLANGLNGSNPGGLLFQVKGDPVGIAFNKQSDNTGGFIAPGMNVSGLSVRTGPVSGNLDDIAADRFKPEDFFDKIDAKLFGVFQLSDILGGIGLDDAPKFITQALDVVEGFIQDVQAFVGLIEDLKEQLDELEELTSNLSSIVDEIATETLGIVEAVRNIDPEDIDGSVDAIIAAIDELDASLGDLASEIDGIDDRLAAGLQQNVVQRISGLRKVIEDGLKTAEAPLRAFVQAVELAKSLTVKLEWRPPIKSDSLGIFEPLEPKQLLLSVELRGKDSPGKPAGVDLIASLENFNLNLIAPATTIILEFERLQFRVASGKKPEIDVVFTDIVFDGVLSFVQKLRELIPIAGFSDPPNVDVSPEGIEAGFTLGLPNVAVGVFSLENMSLSAGFRIPFIGPPLTVNFGFCKREQPFVLTVAMLGGGGFFGITISPGGIEVLEAALEFGASLSVDFGVASGGVSIKAGIYFRMETDEAVLTGYLRIRGEVCVIGLITASLEMRMELTYEFSSHKMVGRATVEIEVSILMFSTKVKVKAERKFAGSNEDPTFAELMAPMGDEKPWEEYLAAFAA